MQREEIAPGPNRSARVMFFTLLTATGAWLLPGALHAQDRVRAWQQDLEVAVSEFMPKDRSFSPRERMAFERAVAVLYDSVPVLSDREITMRLARALALSEEAHTRIFLLRIHPPLPRYPIRVWNFPDGLYVVAARPEYRDLLGKKIVQIAGRPVDEVAEIVEQTYAGNDSWDRYMSTYTLTSPDVLLGWNVIKGDGSAVYTFEDDRGRTSRRRLEPEKEVPKQHYNESWWALAPTYPGSHGPWETALRADTASAPLYLRHATRRYWSHYLPQDSILYFRLNRSDPMADEPVKAFQERLLAEISARNPQKLVVDLRFNTGGDLTSSYPLFQELAKLPLAKEPGRLFVITGQSTFSAALFPAAYLKSEAKPVFVGEPAGEDLDFWAEGGNVTLPNSGLILHYTDRFHGYSTKEYPELAQWYPGLTKKELYFVDMSVPDIDLDIPVELTSADFFAGRDPVLEAIRRYPSSGTP